MKDWYQNSGQGYWELGRETSAGGKIKAVCHRILNPTGDYASQRRLAVIFFGSLKPYFSLAPLPNCIEEMTKNLTAEEKNQYLLKYPDVTVVQFTKLDLWKWEPLQTRLLNK